MLKKIDLLLYSILIVATLFLCFESSRLESNIQRYESFKSVYKESFISRIDGFIFKNRRNSKYLETIVEKIKGNDNIGYDNNIKNHLLFICDSLNITVDDNLPATDIIEEIFDNHRLRLGKKEYDPTILIENLKELNENQIILSITLINDVTDSLVNENAIIYESGKIINKDVLINYSKELSNLSFHVKSRYSKEVLIIRNEN